MVAPQLLCHFRRELPPAQTQGACFYCTPVYLRWDLGNAGLQQKCHSTGVAFLYLQILLRTTMALLRLRSPLALGPALLHHLGDTLARGRTHVAAGPLGCSTTYRPSTTAPGAKSFQRRDGSIKAVALSLKVSQYILNVHASPLEVVKRK